MPSCAIITCRHRSDLINFQTNGITFHRFPSDPEIKKKWIEATCRGPVWWPLKRSTICSIHFTEDEFRPLPKSRRLFEWAVPTLKLPQKPNSSPKHEITETKHVPIKALRKLSDVDQPILPVMIDSNKTIVSGTVNPPVEIYLPSVKHEINLETVDVHIEALKKLSDVNQSILPVEIDSNKRIVSGTVNPLVEIDLSSVKHEINLETEDVPIEALQKLSDVNQPILPVEIDSNKRIVSGTVNPQVEIDLSSVKHEVNLETNDVPIEALKKLSDINQPILLAEIGPDKTIVSGTVNPQVEIDLSSVKHEVNLETNDVPIDPLKKLSDVNQPILLVEIGSVVSGTVNLPAKIDLDKETESARLDKTPRERKMHIQLERYKGAIRQKNRKIRNLQKQTSRYRKKIGELKDVMKQLQEKK